MTLNEAFTIVLDMADDAVADCRYDRMFRDDIGQDTLQAMEAATKMVRDFSNE